MKEQLSNPEKGILAVDWVIAIKILSILESRHHHRIYDTHPRHYYQHHCLLDKEILY